MLNKISAFAAEYDLIHPGDRIVCGLSGGADSVSLLWALYLLRDKLKITLEAAHFNHGLRGEESQRDQEFVKALCDRYDIPLHIGSGKIQSGEKGLEAAAREARYGFFAALPGKIATAHTADDNAETVLMHLVRGTGLKGLGGISPVRGNIIRPMLTVTRQEVLAFLEEYHLSYVEDSSNCSDAFFRNRIRHSVMPLLRQENPSLGENVSQMALRLRQEEACLETMVPDGEVSVMQLCQLPAPIRRRYLISFLEGCGIREPETEHILLAERLVFSPKPSASADFPGGIRLRRSYDRLEKAEIADTVSAARLSCPGMVEYPELGIRIVCEPAMETVLKWDRFTVVSSGEIWIRGRLPGDSMRLQGGKKKLKELMINYKIPANRRASVPVIADTEGVLAVWGIGANLDRVSGPGRAVEIRFEKIETSK